MVKTERFIWRLFSLSVMKYVEALKEVGHHSGNSNWFPDEAREGKIGKDDFVGTVGRLMGALDDLLNSEDVTTSLPNDEMRKFYLSTYRSAYGQLCVAKFPEDVTNVATIVATLNSLQ